MTIKCKGNLIDLSTPKVMGILNLTPDSFYDGGTYKETITVLKRVEQMLEEGATFIDIGAYSSRPGADFVSEEEELSRLMPLLQEIIDRFPEVLISVDTFRASVAKETIGVGATLINDISGGLRDPDMLETVAALQVPYIMMHMRGTSQTMQSLTQYEDIASELLDYFAERLSQARQLGIHDVIFDPGFGFAKTLEQNYEVLGKLDVFNILDIPLLVGLSRKSMIYKLLEIKPENALNGTTALHTIALQQGANILRGHDVKAAVECIQIRQQMKEIQS